MPDLIILRLYPAEPTTAAEFTNYLNDLEITAYDFSFNQISGEQIGQAKYLPSDLSNSRISQNFTFETVLLESPVLKLHAVATALIEVPDGRTEYRFSDLRFTIARGGKEIINRSVHYNVPVVSVGTVPQPIIPNPSISASDPYGSLNPISVYLSLPDPGRELDPNVAYVELPADGTPPRFDELKEAVKKVLRADPTVVNDADLESKLANLTPGQCKHIAYEITWNRKIEPPPVLRRSLEAMYTKPDADSDEAERDRQRFEAELYSYYATHNAKADQLSRYIYALSAALFCERQSIEATQVKFAFPVRLTSTDTTSKIKQAEVMLSNP